MPALEEKKKCLAASRPGPRPARTHQGGKLEERVAAALREAAAELAANGTPATEDELAEVAAEAVKEQRAELQCEPRPRDAEPAPSPLSCATVAGRLPQRKCDSGLGPACVCPAAACAGDADSGGTTT